MKLIIQARYNPYLYCQMKRAIQQFNEEQSEPFHWDTNIFGKGRPKIEMELVTYMFTHFHNV